MHWSFSGIEILKPDFVAHSINFMLHKYLFNSLNAIYFPLRESLRNNTKFKLCSLFDVRIDTDYNMNING